MGIRLHILIDDELYVGIERLAHAELLSKAEMVRRVLRLAVAPLLPLPAEPLDGMEGADDFEPSPLLPGDVYR